MDGLIRNYQFNYQTLKDELGEDPNLISAALQPRVTAGNVETSQQQAEYATDYIYKAYAYCMADTGRKVSCLLKDSVTYGSQAYRNIIKPQDIGNRIFTTKVQFLPTQQEVARFDALLNQAMNTTPELTLFVDPFRLVRIAQEDVKLAETLFRQGQKKMLLWKEETAKQNQDATFKAQNQAAITAEEEKRKSMQYEVNTKGTIEVAISKEKQKEALITGFMGAMQKGIAIPSEWKGVESELIQNLALPLFSENMQNVKTIEQGERQAQEQDANEQLQQSQEQSNTQPQLNQEAA